MASQQPVPCDNFSSSSSQQEVLSSISTLEKSDNLQPLSKDFKFAVKIKIWIIDLFKFLLIDDLVKEDPFNTLLLKAYYIFASRLMLALFLFVTTFYYADGPLHCIDRHDRSTPPESFINYCLSYPYTEIAVNGDKNNIDRHYALHYRWIHLVFFILSFIYLLVKKVIKMLQYRELSIMLEKLCKCNIFNDGFNIAKLYYLQNRGRHGGMYTKFIAIHIISLLINVAAFFGLNIGLQNQYWNLPKHLLTERDPESFDDAYSLIFPPFIKCEITVDHYVLIDRTKRFGCQLTLMQVYEKIFMLLWAFQVFLAVWNLLFLIMYFPFPYWHKWRVNLLLNKSTYNKFDPFKSFSEKYPISELFALGCVHNLLPGHDYMKLIRMYDCDEIQDSDVTLYEESEISKQSPPVGFGTPTSLFQQNLISTPFRRSSPLATRQNRRASGTFELTSRHSIGFESVNETNFPDYGNDTTQFFTPLKGQSNTFSTPMEETPEPDSKNKYTNSCNQVLSMGSTENPTDHNIFKASTSEEVKQEETWD